MSKPTQYDVTKPDEALEALWSVAQTANVPLGAAAPLFKAYQTVREAIAKEIGAVSHDQSVPTE